MKNTAPNNEQLNNETKAYLKRFHNPETTAYNFLNLFFAVLYHDGLRQYPREFSDIIHNAKQNPKYSRLLGDIHFRSNGVFWYSNQIEDGIFKLKLCGLIATLSPKDDIILLQYNPNIVDGILKSFTEEDIQNTREIIKRCNL
jgi:hypothetical protein